MFLVYASVTYNTSVFRLRYSAPLYALLLPHLLQRCGDWRSFRQLLSLSGRVRTLLLEDSDPLSICTRQKNNTDVDWLRMWNSLKLIVSWFRSLTKIFLWLRILCDLTWDHCLTVCLSVGVHLIFSLNRITIKYFVLTYWPTTLHMNFHKILGNGKPITLLARQSSWSAVCLCLDVRTITCKRNDLWPKCFAC